MQTKKATHSTVRIWLLELSRTAKLAVTLTFDFAIYSICAASCMWLAGLPVADNPALYQWTAVLVAVGTIAAAWPQGLYRTIVRFATSSLLASAGVAAGFAALCGFWFLTAQVEILPALRWAVLYWSTATLAATTSRHFARRFLSRTRTGSAVENVVIYGAGDTGAALASALEASTTINLVAFVDDDTVVHRRRIAGVSIYSPQDLETLIVQQRVSRLLLAMPKVTRRRRRRILERLSELPVHVQTVPDFQDIVSGRANVDEIRDVEVKDLLGRDAVPPDEVLLRKSITGKSVMVTGAGGSIGSELCRQVLMQSPKRLVLFEVSESALYEIDKELNKLRETHSLDVQIVSLLGSVHHQSRMREALSAFEVETVYHAAAYKHVPIVERNVFEGIHNNVFGTFHTLRACVETGVRNFVLVSTDKAVNPTNVMGATKRFAEMIVQAFQQSHPATRMSIVRFGNVLESSGSVVPLFREQIRSGGPVTVTHRDIIRYFMTIPEAAELVIQAGSMAQGGDVFVLDMGKPVRIHDLACRMIKLMGLSVRDEEYPDGDIEIEYIGLRPAEKLYEELLIGGNVSGTDHPRILRAHEDFLPPDVLEHLLDDLMETALDHRYEDSRSILLRAVTEYSPENEVNDLVWKQKLHQSSRSQRIVDFPKKHA